MDAACRILVLNGPNLQLLGTREPDIYGTQTYEQLKEHIENTADELGITVEIRQSNNEGQLIDWICGAPDNFDAILINPAAYTHTSLAIQDALAAVNLPACEVHLSNIHARGEARARSLTAQACLGQISGFGFLSYSMGLAVLVEHLQQ